MGDVETLSAGRAAFNYAALDHDLASEAADTAHRIRGRLRSAYVDTGLDLVAMKDKLGHGHFGAWLTAEFDMSERTAQNYMNAAKFVEGKSATIAELPQSIVFALAAPSAPQTVVQDVLAAIDVGDLPEGRAIKARLAEAVEAQRKAKADAKKTDEQRRREQKRKESRAARDAREAAEVVAEKAKRELKLLKTRENLTPLVERIAGAILPSDLSALAEALSDYRTGDTIKVLIANAAAFPIPEYLACRVS